MSERVLVPFPPRASIGKATACRATLLAGSQRALRDRGIFADYEKLLAPDHKDAVLHAIAGPGIPRDAALAHYEAMDGLGFGQREQMAIGADVFERVESSFFGTVLKLATGAGATPWLGLQHFGRIYDRIFDGGASEVVEVGPKDARIAIVGLPLARVTYFRNAYAGFIKAGCELFCKTAVVRTIPRLCSDTALGFRLSWA